VYFLFTTGKYTTNVSSTQYYLLKADEMEHVKKKKLETFNGKRQKQEIILHVP
jgi:hypothetical protein